MADLEVSTLLREWNFEELISQFEENGIDYEAFSLLNDSSIRELIPKVGLRVKFSAKWQAYMNAKAGKTESSFLSDSTNDESLSLDLDDFEASTVKAHSPGSQTTLSVSSDDSAPSHSRPPDMPSSSSYLQLPKLVRQKAVHFDVINLLENSVRGKTVIQNIRKDRILSPSDRRILVSLCVAELVFQYGDKPTSFHKEALAQAITEAFPCLKDSKGRGHEAFYMKGSTGRPASGWLEEHLKYTRKRMKRSDGPVAVSDEKNVSDDVEIDLEPVSEEEAKKMQVWMLHNNQPRSTLENYMRKTVKARLRIVKSSGFTEAISQFPKILAPGMIEQDFQMLYPQAADKLYEKWPSLYLTVTTYAEKNFPSWQEQLPWDCSVLQDEQKAFLALPIICQSRHKRKKGMGSSSLNSSVKSFIDIYPNVTNVEQYCKNIKAEERPQPFMLILWDQKQDTRQFFVVFERRCLPSSSLLKAVDTCFKLHFVLNVHFQTDCFASWQFLQSVVYEMDSERMTEINTVRAFRAYYNSA